MSGGSRAQREVVEASTDGEARIIIDSPEDLQDELDRLTFEPRRSSPDPPEVGPDVLALALQHVAERDEARRQRDEQVALRAEEREAANAAFKAADADDPRHSVWRDGDGVRTVRLCLLYEASLASMACS